LYVWFAGTWLASVTVTLTLNGLPALLVGLPLITPVLLLMLKPDGSPVAVQLKGAVPPVAAMGSK
jgi:hypothetical protein